MGIFLFVGRRNVNKIEYLRPQNGKKKNHLTDIVGVNRADWRGERGRLFRVAPGERMDGVLCTLLRRSLDRQSDSDDDFRR